MVWWIAPEAYAEKVSDVRAACETEGRDPATFRLSVGLYSLVGEDEAAARAAFERGRAAAPGNVDGGETTTSRGAATLSRARPSRSSSVSPRSSRSAWRRSIVAPWVLPFAIHEPEQVELFAERVIAPSRAG